MPPITDGRFTVTEVIRLGLVMYRRNWIRFSLLMLGYLILGGLIFFTTLAALGYATPYEDPAQGNRWMIIVVLLVVALICFAFIHAFIALASVETAGGHRLTLGGGFSRSIRTVLPMTGLYLLFVLMVILLIAPFFLIPFFMFATPTASGWFFGGFLLLFLLIIPASIFVYALLYMAATVMATERTGFWRGLSRSLSLSKGARWKIVGVILILWVGFFIVNAVLQVFAIIPFLLIPVTIAMFLWQAFYLLISLTTQAAAYYLARIDKEGLPADDVAAAFD